MAAEILAAPSGLVVKVSTAQLPSDPAVLIVKSDPAVLLQAPTGFVFADWSSLFDDLEVLYYYACDITDGTTTIRKPISSWQATLQLNTASYAQVVIPAAEGVVAAVEAMTNPVFVIYKGVQFGDGSSREEEICRAPCDTLTLAEGPTNTTLTIQGYTTFPAQPGTTRTLQNIRTQFTAGSDIRVRADIDLFLRPGQKAIARGREFTASFINYYANQDDQHMDVGQR